MEEKKTNKKDIWSKLDVIFKGIAAIMITGAIAFYGISSEKKQFKTAEANRKAQILVQTMNHRETAAADMRAQMFQTLMQHYFKEDTGNKTRNEKTRIVILELIGLNFQDHIHLKPLFEELDSELLEKKKDQERELLRKAAKNIVRKEIGKIIGSGGEIFPLEMDVNQKDTLKGVLVLTLIKVEEDRVRVSSDPEDEKGFEITYYDTPFMDNSRLNEMTYSVLLSKTDEKSGKAEVKVVFLPEHFYSARDNLRFDKLIGDYLYETVK